MMFTKLSRWLMKKSGWRVEGEFPDLQKCVAIGAPHTSMWDFYYAMLFVYDQQLKANILVKKEMFFFPLNLILRAFGAIPVKRGRGNNTVAEVAAIFKQRQRLIIGLSPEGTRSRVERWKTGFYHIAHAAKVPVVVAYLDYKRKVIGIKGVIESTGNVEKDMQRIKSLYEGVTGKYPEKFSTGNIKSSTQHG